MDATQKAIVSYLTAASLATTVKAYAGEARKVTKMREVLDSILVMFIHGKPAAEDLIHQFDLLVVTETAVFDRETNRETNLLLASQVADHIYNNPVFSDATYNYSIDGDTLDVELLLQDDRFTVIVIHLYVEKHHHS